MRLTHRNPFGIPLAVILVALSAFHTSAWGTASAQQSQTSTFASPSAEADPESAVQDLAQSSHIKTYNIVTTFYEPMLAPNNSVFYGAFKYNTATQTPYSLYGELTESMTQQPGVQTPEMTAVALGHQLSSVSDANGGLLLSTFALNTTNVFDPGGFGSGGTIYYGYGSGAKNPSQGGVGNAYVTVDIDKANPVNALTSEQLDLEAYGDCTNLGMMGKTCMTGIAGGGTMMGYPYSQTVTATGSTTQSVTFGTAPTLTAGGDGMTPTATAQATANSGLAVIYSSLTPKVCFVYRDTGGIGTFPYTKSGQTCIVAADQFGNSTYKPATRAKQHIKLAKFVAASELSHDNDSQ